MKHADVEDHLALISISISGVTEGEHIPVRREREKRKREKERRGNKETEKGGEKREKMREEEVERGRKSGRD